jgi:hypothetical protein
MASQYIHRSGPARPELVFVAVEDTIPAATANYVVDLPAGCYSEIAIYVESSVTGTTTTIGNCRAFYNKEQTVVDTLSSGDYSISTPADGAGTTKVLTLAAGADGSRHGQLLPLTSAVTSRSIVLPYGFRLTLTKGTAVEGEKCIITVVAARWI